MAMARNGLSPRSHPLISCNLAIRPMGLIRLSGRRRVAIPH